MAFEESDIQIYNAGSTKARALRIRAIDGSVIEVTDDVEDFGVKVITLPINNITIGTTPPLDPRLNQLWIDTN